MPGNGKYQGAPTIYAKLPKDLLKTRMYVSMSLSCLTSSTIEKSKIVGMAYRFLHISYQLLSCLTLLLPPFPGNLISGDVEPLSICSLRSSSILSNPNLFAFVVFSAIIALPLVFS